MTHSPCTAPSANHQIQMDTIWILTCTQQFITYADILPEKISRSNVFITFSIILDFPMWRYVLNGHFLLYIKAKQMICLNSHTFKATNLCWDDLLLHMQSTATSFHLSVRVPIPSAQVRTFCSVVQEQGRDPSLVSHLPTLPVVFKGASHHSRNILTQISAV